MKNRATQHPLMNHIRAIRRGRKLKQEQVAEWAGLSREAYLRAESGAADPRLSTVSKAAAALGYQLALVLIEKPVPASDVAPVSIVQTSSEAESA